MTALAYVALLGPLALLLLARLARRHYALPAHIPRAVRVAAGDCLDCESDPHARARTAITRSGRCARCGSRSVLPAARRTAQPPADLADRLTALQLRLDRARRAAEARDAEQVNAELARIAGETRRREAIERTVARAEQWERERGL